MPSLEVYIVHEGFMIQGTVFSLVSYVTIEDRNVNSILKFSGSWSRFRARNYTWFDEAQDSYTVSEETYHRNTLTFDPLKNSSVDGGNYWNTYHRSTLTFDPLKDNSVDGGDYVFFVNVSANSSFIKPVVASANITLVISGYPKLNISTSLQTGRCQPERGANLSSLVNILNSTSSQRNITHTWMKTGYINQENGGPILFNDSFRIESLTENDTGIYTVNVCLKIPESGLENHCSNTSLNMLLKGEVFPFQLNNLIIVWYVTILLNFE